MRKELVTYSVVLDTERMCLYVPALGMPLSEAKERSNYVNSSEFYIMLYKEDNPNDRLFSVEPTLWDTDVTEEPLQERGYTCEA